MRKWFRDARKKVGLTQEALARRVGVTLGTIANWELGKNDPHHLAHDSLARELQVDVKSMLASEKQSSVA